LLTIPVAPMITGMTKWPQWLLVGQSGSSDYWYDKVIIIIIIIIIIINQE
jgi:hypothetical protein